MTSPELADLAKAITDETVKNLVESRSHAPLLHQDENGRTVAYLGTLQERNEKGHLLWLRPNGNRE